jgi:hypothetical protein
MPTSKYSLPREPTNANAVLSLEQIIFPVDHGASSVPWHAGEYTEYSGTKLITEKSERRTTGEYKKPTDTRLPKGRASKGLSQHTLL